MQRDFNTLLIPVESQVRELDGKLLLACIAAEKGFTTIIGSRAPLHYHSSKVKNAIYLAKSMRRFSNRMFSILHGLGHRIVALDEEALVRLPDKQYYTHRLSPITFKYIDHLFCWGESDAAAFKHYPNYQGQPIHKVGNPRIDMLRPELREYFAPERNKLLENYGNYILINSNFGQINHFIAEVGSNEANRDKNFSTQDNDEFIAQRYDHKKKLFAAFQDLIPYLAKTFPDIHFILRPHPSESVDIWKNNLSQYNNVSVTNEGNVIPWIMGAKALISNGCTTSIEASVLNKPTLGYYPISNILVDDRLPKLVSHICESNEQLAEKLADYTQTDSREINNTDILNQHISNLTGELSCENIVNLLDYHYKHMRHRNINVISAIPSLIHNNTRTLIKKLKSKNAASRNNHAYHLHRFPPISEEEINAKIQRFSALTGRFKSLKVNTIKQDIFSIYS